MKTSIECIPCFARQAVEAVTMAVDDGPDRERILRQLLRELVGADWSETPVSISRDLHRTIRTETGRADPYRPLKDRMNRTALNLLPTLVDLAGRHPDPREAVVRLAIAGNLLDSGAKSRLEPEDIFFLLAIKCPAIATEIGAPMGALVVKRAHGDDAP